ncbi:MAG: biotin/lipoyl-binding protein [Clostridia bacterium]|nr:biotin/lipoyl-binding protein [Clostridia bacterium]
MCNAENGALKKNKKKFKKRWIVAGIVVLAFICGILYIKSRIPNSSVPFNMATAERGTVLKTVVSSGPIDYGETVEIDIPSGIAVEKVLVSQGDYVEKGQALAKVSVADSKEKLAEVRQELDALDRQLNSSKNKVENEVIKSGYSGRVKKLYAQKGKDSSEIILEHGSVMILSVDGKMAVDFESSEALKKNDSVSIKIGDSVKKGTVSVAEGNKYTATISDKEGNIDDSVVILKGDNQLAEGKLYISRPVTVGSAGGKILDVYVKENDSVSVGTRLLNIEGAKENTQYLKNMERREKLMKQYTALTFMAQRGEIVAESGGTVKSVNLAVGGQESASSAKAAPSTPSAMQGMDESMLQAQMQSESAEDSVNSSSAFVLATDKLMKMNITIDETDILTVKKGMDVTITLDFLPGKVYKGVINKIGGSTGGTGSAGYTAEVLVEKDESLLAGMHATATITIDKKENVVMIPVNAIQEVGGEVFVFTVSDKNGLSGERKVTTGLSDGTNVEITSGLEEGEDVYFYGIYTDFSMDEMLG